MSVIYTYIDIGIYKCTFSLVTFFFICLVSNVPYYKIEVHINSIVFIDEYKS